uniref:Uncharacterized protein n=1 Tax=Canis lupus dingo TaxID=286419 RepID=A0A8C0JM82_CANLU
MQQSGAAGGRGCALLPLLGVLFFQGESSGWRPPLPVGGLLLPLPVSLPLSVSLMNKQINKSLKNKRYN